MLTDAKIKAAKPSDRDYKLSDAAQLYLLVTKAGGKLWRMNYTFGLNANGKPAQKTLSIGSYPALTLLEARRARDEAKGLLRQGRDPSAAKQDDAAAKLINAENTFARVATQWFELKSGWSVERYHAAVESRGGKWRKQDAYLWQVRDSGVWSLVHASDVLRSLERDVFPSIGHLPIAEIESPTILRMLNKIVARGAIETAHRACQRISDVYIYAIPAGVAVRNPAASMKKTLPQVPRTKKRPSIVDGIRDHADQIHALRQMLRDCDAVRCRATTKLAMRLIALTAVRPNELHGAAWYELEDMDGPNPVWRIPASRMKGDEARKAEVGGDHIVPLTPQAVEVIRCVRQLNGNYPLMFPNERDMHKPMTADTLRKHLIRAGYHKRHVPHGFRAAMSTIMNERPDRKDGDRAVIDLMLAHVPKDRVEGAYNRAEYMPRRRELAHLWADLISEGLDAPESLMGRPMRSYSD